MYKRQDRADVADSELLPIIADHVDSRNPREWYWALMDYGVSLKKLHKNPARKSKHHTKQSKFEGSNRQLRGKILKLLLQKNPAPVIFVAESLSVDTEKVLNQLDNLKKEGLIVLDRATVRLR